MVPDNTTRDSTTQSEILSSPDSSVFMSPISCSPLQIKQSANMREDSALGLVEVWHPRNPMGNLEDLSRL